jgi:hypothetical protein
MSWKSFVTAGLLCAIASPVFAAPTIQIVPGGTFANNHLNAAGDWVWNVRLSQTDPPVDVDNAGPLAPGSPLGAELGFQELVSELLGATNLADGFGTDNPGRKITGWDWLTLTATGGTGDCNTGTPGLCPTGLQSDTATDQVFAAIGSVDYLSDTDGKGFVQITIDGPATTANLGTTLQLLGAYSGNGRISELNDAFDPGQPTSGTNPYSVNYDTFAGQVAREARGGDADLNGAVNFDDFTTLFLSYNQPGAWYQGDSTGNGIVNFDDFTALFLNYNTSYSVITDGTIPGGGSGGAVPEPTAAVLALIAGCAFLGRRGR